MAFPTYWMVQTAFRPLSDNFESTPRFWPSDLTLYGMRRALDDNSFWINARNSMVIALGAVLLASLLGLLAAYAIGRFRFYGRKPMLVILLGIQMLPQGALLIAIYLQLNEFGATNQLWSVILVYMTFNLPFAVWMLRGFVINIPVELEEAALVDGCGRMGAFWRVTMPLLAPGLVATATYTFIQAWNEYQMAYILLDDSSKRTLTVWMVSFTTSRGTDYAAMMAGATLTAIPVVVLFLIVQRRMAAGLTAGAVKG
jgi:N,N'-diacetylchitobiose transport system permease protein